jgi:hypothetical protein
MPPSFSTRSFPAACILVMFAVSSGFAQPTRSRIPLSIPPAPAAERRLAGILEDWQNERFDRVREGIVRLHADHPDAAIPVKGDACCGEA